MNFFCLPPTILFLLSIYAPRAWLIDCAAAFSFNLRAHYVIMFRCVINSPNQCFNYCHPFLALSPVPHCILPFSGNQFAIAIPWMHVYAPKILIGNGAMNLHMVDPFVYCDWSSVSYSLSLCISNINSVLRRTWRLWWRRRWWLSRCVNGRKSETTTNISRQGIGWARRPRAMKKINYFASFRSLRQGIILLFCPPHLWESTCVCMSFTFPPSLYHISPRSLQFLHRTRIKTIIERFISKIIG